MVASKSKASKGESAAGARGVAAGRGAPGPPGVAAGRGVAVGPEPGRGVRGSRSGRPVMALLDLLGRRWALRVLWELREESVPTFRELQARCDMVSSSVLSQRVRELRAAGIVFEDRLSLTAEGRELLAALAPLDGWARRWEQRVRRRGQRAGAGGPPRAGE